MKDSISKLAELRAKKKKKEEDTVADVYGGPRLDDPDYEDIQKQRRKLKPFYDRLKEKQG